MYYVELMRARRVLFWYSLVLLGMVAITGLSMLSHNLHVSGGNIQGTVPFSSIVGGAAFGALVIATLMVQGLNAEFATSAITWTRPVPRDRTAWTFVGIDVATIVVGYLLAVAFVLSEILLIGLHRHVVFDAGHTLALFLVGVGGGVMWYAIVSLAASRLPGRGALFAGLSWPVFVIALSLLEAPFPQLIHWIVVVLNFLNPAFYMGGLGSSTHQDAMRLQYPAELRAAAEFAIALVALVVATRLWSTKEA